VKVLSAREASIFACLCDTVVAPAPPLPAVADTDAVEAFDRYLADSPPLNRLGMRAMVHAAELAPRVLGHGARLRRLEETERARWLARAESSRAKPLVDVLEFIARLTYFGDDGVMRLLGYDAETRRP
jgi:hypothetical protein